MKQQYDLMLVGPASRDENIDYTGAVDKSIGGAVTFCSASAQAASGSVFAAVVAAPNEPDVMDSIILDDDDKMLIPSSVTTSIRNQYFKADRERRESKCIAQSDPVTPDKIPAGHFKMYHLAGLLYGDFPNELIVDLASKGQLAGDAQGFLRHNENGAMVFHDWADKKEMLKHFAFLKTDALEALTLTGFEDRAKAAEQLYQWGAKEVMVSHNSEIMVYDGNKVYTCPIKARNLSGRTGRGDTTTGAYLARRLDGDDVETALLYATACVSLKMEKVGVFSHSRQDVYDYIAQFYR